MFHPVGPQPQSVYWRRRLMLFGSLAVVLVLILLTAKIATSQGSDAPAADARSHTPPPTHAAGPLRTSAGHRRTAARTAHAAAHASASPSSTPSTSASSAAPPPPPCDPGQLSVAAVSSKPSYHVGEQPVLELQVTNHGSQPCVQDLADRQVELKVYNGESRVWGSHDCQIQPGTNERTLMVGLPVRVAITWSGLSSQPHCAGTRQRVGVGTYTLYATLSGHTGKATTFTIS